MAPAKKRRKKSSKKKPKKNVQQKMPTFECPRWETIPNLNCKPEEEKPGVELVAEVVPSEWVGTYDLIFVSTTAGAHNRCFNRLTKGKLELAIKEVAEEEEENLCGTISLDNSVKNDLAWCFGRDLTFETTTADLDFRLTNLGNDIEAGTWEEDLNKVYGCIMMTAESSIAPYCWEERGGDDDYGTPTTMHRQQYKDSIPQFQTTQQARDFLQESRKKPLLWLNRLFPVEVSQLVQSFATALPQPLFIFEKGDLFLEIEWCTDSQYPWSSNLVARRRA